VADFNLPWGGDLTIDATGDIATVQGTTELTQRVVRRFLSNSQSQDPNGKWVAPPDYIFAPTYGGNACSYVGSLFTNQTARNLQSRFLAQCALEIDVASTPAPIINVWQANNGSDLHLYAQVWLRNGADVLVPQITLSGA
jgi:hypothetical protein